MLLIVITAAIHYKKNLFYQPNTVDYAVQKFSPSNWMQYGIGLHVEITYTCKKTITGVSSIVLKSHMLAGQQ